MEHVSKPTILHVMVVGFHHKKGYQVEYCYPPISSNSSSDTNELPEEWKNLPSLALPDGSHNFTEDSVYFHLPSRDVPYKTIYCVSCYRQIDAKDLLSRGAEITRNSVQKSVCVLSNLPLYGLIKAKLELVTHAYFAELDFSQVSLLQETYENLNAQLTDNIITSSQVFIGLSCRNIIRKFHHQVLMLFKLLLLEKKVLFYATPVQPVCDAILSLVSLFPGMIEYGLEECLDTRPSSLTSPTLTIRSAGSGLEEFLEVHYHSAHVEEGEEVDAQVELIDKEKSQTNMPESCSESASKIDDVLRVETKENPIIDHSAKACVNNSENKSSVDKRSQRSSRDLGNEEDLIGSDEETEWLSEDKLHLSIESNAASPVKPKTEAKNDTSGNDKVNVAPSSPGIHMIKDMVTSLVWPSKEQVLQYEMHNLRTPSPTNLKTDTLNLPLSVFTKGVLCQPYLSLQYVDLLTDSNVRGFVVGVTNSLFLMRRNLVDVVVELSENKIQINDPELKKLVTLTTADLRFIDDIVQHVSEESGDIFLEDTEWEGGDEWIRAQFRSYLLSLLATVQSGDAKLLEDFGSSFIAQWKLSNNYRQWRNLGPTEMSEVVAGHVCHGQLGVSDIRLRFSHTLQNTEKGRKINTAVSQTGKIAMQTGKAVGGAITNAKSAVTKTVTSWFGGFGRDWNVFGKVGGNTGAPAVNVSSVEVVHSDHPHQAEYKYEISADNVSPHDGSLTCITSADSSEEKHLIIEKDSSSEELLDLK